MDRLNKLNDRNLSFPTRCEIAASFLNPSPQANWLFPLKNQFIFDWLTGSLLKLAKTDSPKPEIFLNEAVWRLLGSFSEILMENKTSCFNDTVNVVSSLKRPISMITSDDEFFDFKKSFDSNSLTIKCPLLSIFQTSLALLNTPNRDEFVDCVEPEVICSVISNFVQQNRVSLPVSFSQVTDFIRSLLKCQSCLPSRSFSNLLRSTLGILEEIILGGAANYKKTYPLLVKFCLESAQSSDSIDIWMNFIEKCLFSQEYIDELLKFLSNLSVLNESTAVVNESTFPKSASFQKALLIELANNANSLESCPIIYEAFLRAAGTKITREVGFNFFTFLLRKTLASHCTSNSQKFTQLAKLISVLQSRGNEIYQQRNDQIYRDQSAVIEEILNSALQAEKASIPFPLLLSLAKLNYYLIVERLDLILTKVDDLSESFIEFIVGMFQLSSLANQLPILLEIILKSNLPLKAVKNQKLQVALIKIFQSSLSPVSLHQIYLTLSENIDNSELCIVLLIPVIRSIVKVVDNVDSFDREGYLNLQSKLFDKGGDSAFNLLAEIIRWSPGTFLLMEDLFNLRANVKIGYANSLNLVCTLKCKDPKRISLKSQTIPDNYELLILKYLPIIAEDLSTAQLESFSFWLLRNEQICLETLKMFKFYEILEIQQPFFIQLVRFINENIKEKSSYISEIISLLPWEFVNDKMAEELIKCLWTLPETVSSLLKLSSAHNVRRETLKCLGKSDEFVEFLFNCTENDLISKCLQVEHSTELIKKIIVKLENGINRLDSVEFVAKILKFADFESEELINFIEKSEINPISLLKSTDLSVKLLDALDVILEWLVDYKVNLVASTILALPANHENLEISVRIQALKCKFPSRTDLEFINEGLEMASKLNTSDSTVSSDSASAVVVTFKKDLLCLVKGLPTEQVKIFLTSLLTDDSWKFSFGLQAFTQLIHITKHVLTVFNLFNDNLDLIYEKSLKYDQIPVFLAGLKSITQLKKNVTWDSKGIANILGVLRKCRQARPECFDEIFVTLRSVVTLHLRQFRALLPLLITNICESFSGVSSVEEATALGRIISELASMKRTELEPFALLPLLNTFICSKYLNNNIRKTLQMSMNNLMYHLGTKKQLLQLLSTALVIEHEHRLILKSFIDEYNKFHKYSGRA